MNKVSFTIYYLIKVLRLPVTMFTSRDHVRRRSYAL